MKNLNPILAGILVIVLAAPNLNANAALPAGFNWTDYASLPVVGSSVCPSVTYPTDPAVVVEAPGLYKMYFNDSRANPTAVYLATSMDGGYTWTCANGGSPVLTAGPGGWENIGAYAATVLKIGPADYRMWYTGRSSSGEEAIGYAASPDGISWAKHPGNPIFTKANPSAWDAQMVYEPSVVQFGGQFHMWYTGTDFWPYASIGHATSPDGISWARDPANPVLVSTPGTWDQAQTYGPSVVVNGSVLEMFYSGAAGIRFITGHATSTDGTLWVKDANAILGSNTAGGWERGNYVHWVAGVQDGSDWKLFYGAGTNTLSGIGLATYQALPQFTFNPLSSLVKVGDVQVVTIELNHVANLYGYQFEVTYDPAKVSASASFVNSFFDTSGSGAVPPGWNAVCAAGVCRFAATLVGAAPVSGAGPLAQITLTGLALGGSRLAVSGSLLSDRDANAINHSTMDGYISIYDLATVSGVVRLQGRPAPLDAGTVTLYHMWGQFAPTTVPFSPLDGSFSASVPVYDVGGYFSAYAEHTLYLSNRLDGLNLAPGGSYGLGATTLKGGDANNDGRITLPDLTCIGGDFGGAPGTCGGLGSTDINLDGFVNIFDLVLPGGNYSLTTPQSW